MLYHVNTEDVDDECTWRYTLTFMYNSSSPINVCLMQLGRIVNPLLDTSKYHDMICTNTTSLIFYIIFHKKMNPTIYWYINELWVLI
jgi:hypothetical protein